MKSEENIHGIGSILKNALKEKSLSLRKFSELTGVDPATVSRIINGKRKATPEHIQRFSEFLNIPSAKLYDAAGYSINYAQTELHSYIDHIEDTLSSELKIDFDFSIDKIEEKLEKYKVISQTKDGKETILKKFESKLKQLESTGPFIHHLKNMFEQFTMKKVTRKELALIGAAILYFIVTTDSLPDYIFPIGYIDDAIVVKIVLNTLSLKSQ